MTTNPLLTLEALGQSVWLDYIRRHLITSGELTRLIEQDGLGGVTSNPSIFEKAIAQIDAKLASGTSAAGREQLRSLKGRIAIANAKLAYQRYKGGPNSGVFLQITCDDAADLPVPGRKYTFGIVKAAQARGDFEVLAARGRRLLRVHLGTAVAAGLERLNTMVNQALA